MSYNSAQLSVPVLESTDKDYRIKMLSLFVCLADKLRLLEEEPAAD